MLIARVPISAQADEIWQRLTTPELMADWMGDVSDVSTSDGGSLRQGSRLRFITRGRRVESEVITFEPLSRIALRSRQGKVEAIYTYTLSGDGPVQAEHAIDCTVKGLLRPLAPLIRRTLVRTDGGQMERLRNLMTAK